MHDLLHFHFRRTEVYFPVFKVHIRRVYYHAVSLKRLFGIIQQIIVLKRQQGYFNASEQRTRPIGINGKSFAVIIGICARISVRCNVLYSHAALFHRFVYRAAKL